MFEQEVEEGDHDLLSATYFSCISKKGNLIFFARQLNKLSEIVLHIFQQLIV